MLLNLLKERSMSNNISSRELRFVSITVSLFLWLNVNFSNGDGFSSLLKCYISRGLLPYSSNCAFYFPLFILLAVRTNVRSFDKWKISLPETFLNERLMALLLTNLPSNLSPFNVAILLILLLSCFSSILGVFSVLIIISFFPPSTLTK